MSDKTPMVPVPVWTVKPSDGMFNVPPDDLSEFVEKDYEGIEYGAIGADEPSARQSTVNKLIKGIVGLYEGGGPGITGNTGAYDNAALRADGPGGNSIQGSSISILDTSTKWGRHVTIAASEPGQPNCSLVLSPSGNGAFIVGPRPSIPNIGGTTRGPYAVDIQPTRTTEDRVAFGFQSVCIGVDCKTSGNYGVAIGNGAETGGGVAIGLGATGSGSSISIGEGAETLFTGSIAIGTACKARNSQSVAIGFQNTTTNSWAVVVGRNSTGGGQESIVLGSSCSTTSNASVAIGYRSSAIANSAVAIGTDAVANRRGMLSHASSPGRQISQLMVMRTTTDATPTELTIDGLAPVPGSINTSNRIIPQMNQCMFVDVFIMGASRTSKGTELAAFHRRVFIYMDRKEPIPIAPAQTVGTDIRKGTLSAAWDVALQVGGLDANAALQIMVTGSAAHTIEWTARLAITEAIMVETLPTEDSE